ncbi:DUF3572 domain-containing protein [Roseicyclus sp.]|uniref:DUF3572 domain-containing protein n=1 Tax=Roseicyclus sp. TaxID=1914329 RepID=UPI001BD184DE|nr:DUF3572 domain-containing protein [Roseicyclus sp.]
MKQETAEIRAMGMLGWLAGQEALLPVFLGATGASEDDLRARAGEAEFLASVVDFVMMDDVWVIDCATDQGWPPAQIMEIRAALPGGDLPAWT